MGGVSAALWWWRRRRVLVFCWRWSTSLFFADPPPAARSPLVGAVARFPSSRSSCWRLWFVKISVRMMVAELASVVVRGGGALWVLSAVDFLLAGGLLPVQALMEEKAAGSAGRTCCATKKTSELRRFSL